MGLNIGIFDESFNVPPAEVWDSFRYQNDVEFTELIDWTKVEKPGKKGSWENYCLFRPTDIERLRSDLKLKQFENEERYLHLLDLLQSKKYWLEFGW